MPTPAALRLEKISDAPLLYQVDGFALDDEIAHILAVTDDEAALERRGVTVRKQHTGTSCELPVGGDAVLEDLRARVEALLGVRNDLGATMRFRRYREGESHPPHRDVYEVADRRLSITAMLYLADTPAGGETVFPKASPSRLALSPRKGRLVVWLNHLSDGSEDPAAEHEALPVAAGEKITLTSFVYTGLATQLPPLVPGPVARPERRATGLRLHCVDEGVPKETTGVLRSACQRRGVEYLSVAVDGFDYAAARPLGRGDLLYRPATSLAAIRVEQFLYSPEVASFFPDAQAVFYDCLTPPLVLERAGLPIPTTLYQATTDRALLRRYVERLGGFPMVVKWLGRSRGVGVLRVDSYPALFSLMDHVESSGAQPLLCRYIADATHYRLVVVGDRVVAAYRNAQSRDDFRSHGSSHLADYLVPIDPAMAEIAVAATRALRLGTAGVDILVAPDGKLYLLEVNFPCYFAQAQLAVGVDIAGMMIDSLVEKAAQGTAP